MGGCTGAFGVALVLSILICACLPFLDIGKVFETLFVILAVAVGLEAILRRSKG